MTGFVLAHDGDPTPGSPFAAPCYRIPALAVTASGRVLAVWDVRADWRDLPGPFDLVVRHSDDHGRTWTPPRFLRAHDGGHGFGDASLLVTASGRVLCWYVGSTGESFFSARADAPGLELWLAASDDDGLTWTHRDLSGLRPAGIAGMFASSGNGVRLTAGAPGGAPGGSPIGALAGAPGGSLAEAPGGSPGGAHPGRLLQPFVLRRPTGDGGGLTHATDAAEHWAAVARSDDGGDTWALGEWIGPDCDEGKVVEAASGAVVLHARARPRRRWAVSTDGGATFTTPVPHPALVDPACNGGLCRWGDVLVSSALDDERERRRLVLRTSADEGATWSPPVLVDAGAAAYSVVAPLADGALGLLYEAGDYEALIFRRITRAEVGLDGAVPTLVARRGAGRARPPEVAP